MFIISMFPIGNGNSGGEGFVVQNTEPNNTKVLWIDTTINTGGLKYYNGTAWVPVPVAYS